MTFSLVTTLRAELDDHTRFLRANTFYQVDRPQDALEQYVQIPNKGHAVWYNMALCHKRIGNYIEAISCFMHARRGAGFIQQREIDMHIAQLQKERGITPDKSQSQRFITPIMHAAHTIPPVALQLLFLLLWYLTLIPSAWVRKRIRSTQLILLCLLAPLLVATYTHQNTTTAVVSPGGSTLFVGPNEAFRTICSLKEGEELTVRDQRTGWYKVCQAGTTGWVPEKNIVVITPEQT